MGIDSEFLKADSNARVNINNIADIELVNDLVSSQKYQNYLKRDSLLHKSMQKVLQYNLDLTKLPLELQELSEDYYFSLTDIAEYSLADWRFYGYLTDPSLIAKLNQFYENVELTTDYSASLYFIADNILVRWELLPNQRGYNIGTFPLDSITVKEKAKGKLQLSYQQIEGVMLEKYGELFEDEYEYEDEANIIINDLREKLIRQMSAEELKKLPYKYYPLVNKFNSYE